MRGARIAAVVLLVGTVLAASGVVGAFGASAPARDTPTSAAAGLQPPERLSPAAADRERVDGSLPDADPTTADAAQLQPDTDATVTRVQVHANGSATWTVEIRTLITNETDVDDYRRFQARFRNDTGRYLGSFRDRIRRLVGRAGEVTGREMAATNFTGETRVESGPRQWGVVEYRFRWSGFAAERTDGLAVGDVFQSGYYLTEGDSMVIQAPTGYGIRSVDPSPDAGDATLVRWVGPIDFGDGRPSLRFVERPTATATTTPTETTGGGPTSGPGTDATQERSGGVPLPSALGVLAVVVLAGAGVYLARGRLEGADPAPTPAADGATDGGRVAETPGDTTPGADADGQEDSTDASGENDTAEEDTEDDAGPADLDPELLTDEERVTTLLADNGGRMKQSVIAEELDWSASKTSRVLSSMADEGAVEKLRLGNENVIDLPEE